MRKIKKGMNGKIIYLDDVLLSYLALENGGFMIRQDKTLNSINKRSDIFLEGK
jgi:hypothetical protein